MSLTTDNPPRTSASRTGASTTPASHTRCRASSRAQRLLDFSEHRELRDLLVAAERLPTWNASLTSLVRTVVTARGARPGATIVADELRRLPVHAQIVWRDRDPFGGPEIGQRAADLIPDAELHVVAGGHGPWFRDAERIADLIRPALQRQTSLSRASDERTHP